MQRARLTHGRSVGGCSVYWFPGIGFDRSRVLMFRSQQAGRIGPNRNRPSTRMGRLIAESVSGYFNRGGHSTVSATVPVHRSITIAMSDPSEMMHQ